MPDHHDRPAADPSSPERNPLGLGPRDRESSNTGSTADTSYDAHGSDPYTTGEPRKDLHAPAGPDADDAAAP
jgi:hypothetical protein